MSGAELCTINQIYRIYELCLLLGHDTMPRAREAVGQILHVPVTDLRELTFEDAEFVLAELDLLGVDRP